MDACVKLSVQKTSYPGTAATVLVGDICFVLVSTEFPVHNGFRSIETYILSELEWIINGWWRGLCGSRKGYKIVT